MCTANDFDKSSNLQCAPLSCPQYSDERFRIHILHQAGDVDLGGGHFSHSQIKSPGLG